MRSHLIRAAAVALLVPAAVVAVSLATQVPAAAAICTARTVGDVNGDNLPDVLIGQSGLTVAGAIDVGAASVMRGAAAGLTATGNQLLKFSDAADGDGSEAQDRYGETVATGFFDGDCFADAAVASPGDDANDGTLTLYKGSSTGLKVVKRIHGHDANSGAHIFGHALAVGDFNHDGYDDLAVGADESTTGGAVGIFYGSSTGLNTVSPAWFTQDTPGVAGVSEGTDQWGYALAAGDFNGDHYADLAVGNPTEDLSGVGSAGDVTILYGTSIGLSGNNSVLFDEGSSGVPGSVEAGDRFGDALAAGDVTGDTRDDLVVGAPEEGIGSIADAGSVFLLKGSAGGLTGIGAQLWNQDSTDVPGEPEQNDEFGFSLAVGDFNGDGKADVAVGVPGENALAGAVDVLPGTASGLTGNGSTAWSQDSTGVPGASEPSDQFGFAVSAKKLTGGSRADLVVGVPEEDGGLGAIDVLLSNGSGLTGTGSQAFSGTELVGGTNPSAQLGGSLSQ